MISIHLNRQRGKSGKKGSHKDGKGVARLNLANFDGPEKSEID
jgi:hypothetical protein